MQGQNTGTNDATAVWLSFVSIVDNGDNLGRGAAKEYPFFDKIQVPAGSL